MQVEAPCNRRGLPISTSFRMIGAKLKPPACTSNRFRMLSLPFRCTRLIPPGFVHVRHASFRQLTFASAGAACCGSPLVRRRLAYTCFCSSALPAHVADLCPAPVCSSDSRPRANPANGSTVVTLVGHDFFDAPRLTFGSSAGAVAASCPSTRPRFPRLCQSLVDGLVSP